MSKSTWAQKQVLDSKCRVLIPQPFRKELGVKAGDEVQLTLINNGQIVVEPYSSLEDVIHENENWIRQTWRPYTVDMAVCANGVIVMAIGSTFDGLLGKRVHDELGRLIDRGRPVVQLNAQTSVLACADAEVTVAIAEPVLHNCKVSGAVLVPFTDQLREASKVLQGVRIVAGALSQFRQYGR